MDVQPQSNRDAARGKDSNQERQTDDLAERPLDLTHPPGTAFAETKDSRHVHLLREGDKDNVVLLPLSRPAMRLKVA
jgi:hypothetical protein